MPRILVVDDETMLVKGIKFNLETEGYTVDVGYNGQEAVSLAKTQSYDLIVLDLMMPILDGLEACLQIRAFSAVPIIMLTARSEDRDKLLGFEYGADDYMTKPFNILELKARIRALLRRAGKQAQAEQADSRISQGTWTLDSEERTAFLNERQESVDLTAKEFDLLALLMRNPGKVYSREQLLNLVWGYDYMGDDRTVDVHVRRLREKMKDTTPVYILTKWGVGYYFKKS